MLNPQIKSKMQNNITIINQSQFSELDTTVIEDLIRLLEDDFSDTRLSLVSASYNMLPDQHKNAQVYNCIFSWDPNTKEPFPMTHQEFEQVFDIKELLEDEFDLSPLSYTAHAQVLDESYKLIQLTITITV